MRRRGGREFGFGHIPAGGDLCPVGMQKSKIITIILSVAGGSPVHVFKTCTGRLIRLRESAKLSPDRRIPLPPPALPPLLLQPRRGLDPVATEHSLIPVTAHRVALGYLSLGSD